MNVEDVIENILLYIIDNVDIYSTNRFSGINKMEDGSYRFHLHYVRPKVMLNCESRRVLEVSKNIKGLSFDYLSLWFTYVKPTTND